MVFRRLILLISLILSLLAGVLARNLSDIAAPVSISRGSHESLMEFWRQTDFKLDQVKQFISFEKCVKSQGEIRLSRACEMALLRLGQICEITDKPSFAWSGIEKFDLAHLENEQARGSLSPLIPQDEKKDYRVRFEELFKSCEPSQQSFALAMSVNSFLSIYHDPHSYLMPIRYFDEVVSKSDSRTNAFGFLIRRNRDLSWVVTKISPGSSAQKSGLISGDKITEMQGKALSQVAPKVILDILNSKQSLNLVIERFNNKSEPRLLRLQLKPLEFQVTNVTWEWANEGQKVGLMRIEKFSRSTCDDFKKALKLLKGEDLKGLVLDLRDNPGGSVEEAACVMDALVEKGQLLFYTYDLKSRSTEHYYSRNHPIFNGGLAILINQGSASASEIVAGGLKAVRRAQVVGQTSFGKGTYQDGVILEKIPSVAFFETRGFYLFSDGSSTQLSGVEPDIRVSTKKPLESMLREEDLYAYPMIAEFPRVVPAPNFLKSNKSKIDVLAIDLNFDPICLEIDQKSLDEVENAVRAISCQLN